MSREDIRQEITNQVIAALENGGLKEWTKPWAKLANCAGGGLPWNFVSGRKYQGINSFVLMMACIDKGFTSTGFLTFNQAQQLGGNVRRGEKGFRVVLYTTREVMADAGKVGEESKQIPFARSFTVFNTSQCENLQGIEEMAPAPLLDVDGKLARIDAIRQRLCDETGLTYNRIGDRAVYMGAYDELRMPAGEWNSTEDFIATKAHELVHATGAKHRLDRRDLIVRRFKDQSETERYAFEELVAELGSAMIGVELGLTGDMQHESYIASWLQALKDDKSYIFKAATLASQAHRYLMGEALAGEQATELSEAA